MYLHSLHSSWQEGRAVPKEQEFTAADDLYPMELEPVYNGKRPLHIYLSKSSCFATPREFIKLDRSSDTTFIKNKFKFLKTDFTEQFRARWLGQSDCSICKEHGYTYVSGHIVSA